LTDVPKIGTMNIYIASKKTTKRGRVTISLKFKMDGRIFD